MGALRVCAVLHKRQGRGWASCPTRPAHAPDPWRPTVPTRGWNPRPDGFVHPAVGRERSMQNRRPVAPVLRFGPPFQRSEREIWLWLWLLLCFLPFALCPLPLPLPFALASASAVASAFAFSSTPIRTGKLSERGVGGLAGPLGAMDGAHEPPGMDSRRVPPTHPPRANPSQRNMALWLRLRLRLRLRLEIRLGEANGQAPTH